VGQTAPSVTFWATVAGAVVGEAALAVVATATVVGMVVAVSSLSSPHAVRRVNAAHQYEEGT